MKPARDLEYYLSLPYVVEIEPIQPEEGGGFEARIPLLGRWTTVGCGETPDEALKNLNEIKEHLFRQWLKEGKSIPEPEPPEPESFNGKILLRTSKELHRELAHTAKEQGVSLNLFLNQVIAKNISSSDAQIPRY